MKLQDHSKTDRHVCIACRGWVRCFFRTDFQRQRSGQLLRKAKQMFIAAEVDGVPDDCWRRMEGLVQFVDRQDLDFLAALKNEGFACLVEQIDTVRRADW